MRRRTDTRHERPRIIVTSRDGDPEFTWLSDGWYQIKRIHTAAAQELMAQATEAIEAGSDVPDAIRRLEEAGFDVTREPRTVDRGDEEMWEDAKEDEQ